MSDLPIIGDTRQPCGPCVACCKPLAVPDLDKPAGQWCDRCEIGAGCTIHTLRPQTCRDFDCAWRLNPGGAFEEGDRPDRLRVLFTVEPSDQVTAPEGLWTARELTPGAFERRRFLRILAGLVRHQRAVLLIRHNSRRELAFDRGGNALRGQRPIIHRT